MDSQADLNQRARLRRAKILANSQARMNRIIGGVAADDVQSSSLSQCDISAFLPDLNQPQFNNNLEPEYSVEKNDDGDDDDIRENILNETSTTSDNKSTQSSADHHHHHPQLPPRDESFPRKVSLISSPIHFRTLQQSQQFNNSSSFTSFNFISYNASLLLFVISCLGSYLSINYLLMFLAFESVQYVLIKTYRNVRFTIGQFFKEFLLSIFCYIMIQAFKVSCNNDFLW